MKMSAIRNCSMASCAFNKAGACHTWGITVGPHAECNTFVHASRRAGFPEIKGGVGACLASRCKHNENLECKSFNIDVAVDEEKHADCMTYSESHSIANDELVDPI
jgi:hypothetical protein